MRQEAAAEPDIAWLARLLEAGSAGGMPRLLRVLLRLAWHQRHRMVPALVASLVLSALAIVFIVMPVAYYFKVYRLKHRGR